MKQQISLFGNYQYENKFPTTRYQGSKNKIIEWIFDNLKNLDFNTVLDAFGGTGCVSYMFKKMGKKVTYNDILLFNYNIGKALIENQEEILTHEEIQLLLKKHENIKYKSFIFDNYKEIYFTDEENEWLDMVCQNICLLKNEYKKCIAYYALYQSCIIKRPYNLFHRANLYIRTSDVKRSFGNKATWEKPFCEHFNNFVNEANNAVFKSKLSCETKNLNITDINGKFDMVYLDPPYINDKGIGVDYLEFYHFLEGISDYNNWLKKIQFQYKHKPIKNSKMNNWTKKDKIEIEFKKVFEKFKDSILVISYREDGIPSKENIIHMLKEIGKTDIVVEKISYKYALSKKNTKELLIIAK